MKDRRARVAVIGPPNVGKTHYGAVLIEKWQAGRGALSLVTPADDLRAFAEARRAIQEGRAAPHTESEKYSDTPIRVRSPDGHVAELVWPDYGGEQMRQIPTLRRVPLDWQKRLQESQAWLLMIRPTLFETRTDLLERLRSRAVPSKDPVRSDERAMEESGEERVSARRWSDGAWWTELLQVLLDAAGVSVVEPAYLPRLVVALSCWDELPEEEACIEPEVLLRRNVPLFVAFLENNWRREAWSVWGISPLGRALSSNSADEGYIDIGPAEQGFAIAPGAPRRAPLDEPLVWLLNQHGSR